MDIKTQSKALRIKEGQAEVVSLISRDQDKSLVISDEDPVSHRTE
jgi:ribosomal protein L7Ae-like RNA K-turn-binding protein